MKKQRSRLIVAVLIVIIGIVLAAGEFVPLRALAYAEAAALLIYALWSAGFCAPDGCAAQKRVGEASDESAQNDQTTQLFQKAILSQAYSYYKVNLTKNEIEPPIIETVNGVALDYSDKFGPELPPYDEMLSIVAQMYVTPEQRADYLEQMSAAYLINQFREGNTMPEYVCYLHTDKLGWHYRKYVNYLSEAATTGDIVAMTVAYDITEKTAQEEEAERRETALLESTHAIYAYKNLNDEINALLATLVNYYVADRAYIVEINRGRMSVDNTYEACREGVEPQISQMQRLPIAVFEGILADFGKNSVSVFNMERKSAFDEDSVVILDAMGITSLLAIPVSEDGELVGFIGVENPTQATRDFVVLRTVESIIHGKILLRRQSDEEHLVLAKISNNTDAVFFVDFETDRMTAYRDPADNAKRFTEPGVYSKTVGDYIEAYVDEKDKAYARQCWDPDYIKKQLEQDEAFSFSIADTFTERHKNITVHVIKANESGTQVVMTAIDNTELIEQERAVQEQLRVARSEAEAANRAKTLFLFNMSHDLRTPMNAIKGFTELAEKYADDRERLLDCLAKVRLSSDHLITLVNSILDLARIETGQIRLEPVRTQLEEQEQLIGSLIQNDIEQKHITYEYTSKNIRDRTVVIDKNHVDQVLINILNNAIKFTPAGGTITHVLEQTDDYPDGRPCFCHTITDTGIGMSREFASRIFERFARERTSTESGKNGVGLGMSIAKELVDCLGGTIEVESEPGSGTTVRVWLPAERCGESAAPTEPDALTPADSGDVSLHGKRVLIVEDNELNFDIESDILLDEGMAVDGAADGRQAVCRVRDKGTDYYDYILMDIQMPVMDGYEATREIRAMPGGENIPIIAVSANAFEEDRQKSLEHGMNAHLAKPVEAAAMIKMLQKYAR